MASQTRTFSAEVVDYARAHSSQPDTVQQAIDERTSELGRAAGMRISPDVGATLSVLVGALRPSFAVEIGTFTGSSALAIARALPDHGRLLCCDVSEKWTSLARDAWTAAGVDDRIDLVIAPAIDTLAALPDGQEVDFAFIDADKTGYLDYYDALLPRLSARGLIAVDNTLWSGAVVDSSDTSPDTEAIRAFNAAVARDPRSEVSVLTIGDGLTLIRPA